MLHKNRRLLGVRLGLLLALWIGFYHALLVPSGSPTGLYLGVFLFQPVVAFLLGFFFRRGE